VAVAFNDVFVCGFFGVVAGACGEVFVGELFDDFVEVFLVVVGVGGFEAVWLVVDGFGVFAGRARFFVDFFDGVVDSGLAVCGVELFVRRVLLLEREDVGVEVVGEVRVAAEVFRGEDLGVVAFAAEGAGVVAAGWVSRSYRC